MLKEKYTALSRELATSGARLIAVTKTHPVDVIRELYDLGHRDFGENRVAELLEKQEALPDDINWHFIGHIQSKKARKLVGRVALVHSGDRLSLLRELDKRSEGTRTDVLLQYHIAQEESKYGLTRDSGLQLMSDLRAEPLKHVRILGVMGMATNTEDEQRVAEEFSNLRSIFTELKNRYFVEAPDFKEVSMGMSGDYAIALKHGSTLVRVGSLLFGARPQ